MVIDPTPAWAKTRAPSAAEIEAIALSAYSQLPDPFRSLAGSILFSVEEFPAEAVLDELGVDSEFDLLGLYHGVSLDRRGSGALPTNPDTIMLYRRPILDYWAEHDDSLEAIVIHVMIHEIGHHFGLSDADMAVIEAATDNAEPAVAKEAGGSQCPIKIDAVARVPMTETSQ